MRDSALFHIRRKANISLSSNGYNKRAGCSEKGTACIFVWPRGTVKAAYPETRYLSPVPY